MTDAPERIWALPDCFSNADQDNTEDWTCGDWDTTDNPRSVEYIRADLADRQTQEAAIAQEARMSDELVKQSIAELQDIVRCDCGSAYLERGRHSHACLHYMAEPVELVANRIEELEANINLKADFIDATMNQLAASDQRIEELEAKLAKAVVGLVLAKDAINGFVDSGDAFDEIKATLAELTGEKS